MPKKSRTSKNGRMKKAEPTYEVRFTQTDSPRRRTL
jgi:hypothetical protein